VNKKQKRIADQYQLQNNESQDSDFPAESRDPYPDSSIETGDPNSKTKEEPESFLIDPHHSERVLRIGSKLYPYEKALFKKLLSDNVRCIQVDSHRYAWN